MRWVTERTTFAEVGLTGTKSVKCSGCGKRLRRQRRFMQTVNPWNKDKESGLPKTPSQINRELADRIAAWRDEPETCSACQESDDAS